MAKINKKLQLLYESIKHLSGSNNGAVSGLTIAIATGISLSSVYSMIRRLRLLGYPIYSSKYGSDRGYSTKAIYLDIWKDDVARAVSGMQKTLDSVLLANFNKDWGIDET